MAVARFEMPDGRIGRFEVPDGTTPEQARAMIAEQMAPKAAKPANPSFDAGRQALPKMRDMLATAQGPTFGFADELIGGVVGGGKTLFNDKPFDQNYQETRDYVRGAVKQQQIDQPALTTASQIAASMAVGGPLTKLAYRGPSAFKQALATGGVGGLTGLINGVGDSEADTLAGVGSDAKTAGGVGAVAGMMLPPVFRGAGAIVGNVASRFDPAAAASYAKQKLAEAFQRDAAKGVSNPAGQAAARLQKLGPEAAVVDAGGANVRQLADTLATLPGQTKPAVESLIKNRQATRADRLIGSAEDAFGVAGVRMAPEMKSWIEKRAKDAAPLYERVHKIDIPATGDLAKLVDVANKQGYSAAAARMAQLDDKAFTLSDDALNQSGKFSVRDLDYLKQSIDKELTSSKMNKQDRSGLNPEGVKLQNFQKQLIDRIDRATFGQYKAAREAFAGPSQLMDAASAGKAILNKDDATIRSVMEGFTRSEKDAFALGAFEALRAKLGARSGQSQMMELWREKGMQEKLKAIFGTEREYREFAVSLAKERTMKGAESIGRGSQTAARQAAIGDLDVGPLREAGAAATAAASGNLLGVMSGATNAWNRIKTPEAVRDQMGNMLMSRGADGRQNLNALMQVQEQIQRERARQMSALGLGIGSQSSFLNP